MSLHTFPDTLDLPLNLGIGLILGLVVGSFLNVVVHRLPLMLMKQWQQSTDDAPENQQAQNFDHREAALRSPTPKSSATPYNLAVPRSHCPTCQHRLAWFDNLPLLSYLWLQGRCRHCQTRIALRYPLLEFITALVFALCFVRYGLTSPQAWMWSLFACALMVLALIDWQHFLLPDGITLPLLWAGLLCADLQWVNGAHLRDSLWGAASAYLSFAGTSTLYLWRCGHEGLGQGDWKLFAALGAWTGWMALPGIAFLGCLLACIYALILYAQGQLQRDRPLPLGSFLVLGTGLWYGLEHGLGKPLTQYLYFSS